MEFFKGKALALQPFWPRRCLGLAVKFCFDFGLEDVLLLSSVLVLVLVSMLFILQLVVLLTRLPVLYRLL